MNTLIFLLAMPIFFDDLNHENFIDLFTSGQFTHYEDTHDANSIVLGDGEITFTAQGTDSDIVSKAAIEREGFDFQPGETVSISARIKIPLDSSLDYLFLLDLECIQCWPPEIPKNQHMGLRLAVIDGRVEIDRGKLGYRQSPFVGDVAVSTDQWFDIEWQIYLSDQVDGWSKVLIDGNVVLDGAGVTLPNYDHIFGLFGLQITDSMYDKVEIGVTANAGTETSSVIFDYVKVNTL